MKITKAAVLGFAVLIAACSVSETCQPGHYEILTYKLIKEASKDEYLHVNRKVEGFLKQQKGFLSRGLGKLNDSTWVDVLSWETKSDFEAAFEKSAGDSSVIEMSKMIDESSYQVLSFDSKLPH